jgi:hypothetical protein
LIDASVLDNVWDANECVLRGGKIQLQPKPAGERDPYPGRYLNPHKKAARFYRILKHADLLHWLRLLMDRKPKTLQTIASHKVRNRASIRTRSTFLVGKRHGRDSSPRQQRPLSCARNGRGHHSGRCSHSGRAGAQDFRN